MKDIVRVSLLTFFTSMICSSLYTQSVGIFQHLKDLEKVQ